MVMTDVVVHFAVTFTDALTLHIIEQLNPTLDHKLDRLINLVQQGNQSIMSQLSDVLSEINDETNLIATSAAADATRTEATAVAVQALRDQIAQLIASGGTPTTADLSAIDAIKTSLTATNTSLVATADRLKTIASDPTNPVPPPV